MRPTNGIWIVAVAALLGTAAGCTLGGGSGRAGAAPEASSLFENVADKAGLAFDQAKPASAQNILETIGHGIGLVDADGDGLLDIVCVGVDQVKLYRNKGNYQFEDISARSGLGAKGYWTGVAVGDWDNDGRPDLFLSGYDASALYRNVGGGAFEQVHGTGLEVAPAAGKKFPEWRTSAGFFDYDNDGKLDLYVLRYADFGPSTPRLCGDPGKGEQFSCSPDVYKPQIGALFHNEGKGKFRDVTAAMGMKTASGRALAVAFADYNGDGFTDVVVANDERPGDLFENLKGKGFVNRGVESGTAFNPNGHVHGGMGADWADYDGDGQLDLFVTTFQNEVKCLYRGLGGGLFTNAGLDAGLAERLDRWVSFGAKFLDYDNDGSPDLMVASGHVINNTDRIYPGTLYRQPLQLFHNRNGVFEEVTDKLGPAAKAPMAGRGLATGDLTNSGRLDVVVSQNEGKPYLLVNNVRNANHWIGIKLVGTRSNRDGAGARVTVEAGGKSQFLDASTAGSYASASDPRIHFGLGATGKIDRIRVRWPAGATQVFDNPPVDGYVTLTEGEPAARAGA